ncbi:MAG: serine kinase [Bacillota bacterium]
MKVRDLIEELELEVIAGPDLDREVDGVYCGDLLSNVMANAKKGNLWLTVQGHQNAAAVALLVDISAVVIVEGFDFDESAIKKACQKGINLLKSREKAYQIACKLCERNI